MKAGRSVRTLMGRLERGINDLEFMREEAVNSPSTTARFPGERQARCERREVKWLRESLSYPATTALLASIDSL
jgi:hypothetical protein